MERRKVETFEDLVVWQKGIAFVKQIYLAGRQGALNRDFGLRDQLQRAAVSIPANIAEGYERASRREYVQFLTIAKGSVGEARCLIRVAFEIGYLDQDQYVSLTAAARDLSGSLTNQIKALKQSAS